MRGTEAPTFGLAETMANRVAGSASSLGGTAVWQIKDQAASKRPEIVGCGSSPTKSLEGGTWTRSEAAD